MSNSESYRVLPVFLELGVMKKFVASFNELDLVTD